MADIIIKSLGEIRNIMVEELEEGTVLSVKLVKGGDEDGSESEE